jgi:hypothetical protein
MQLEAAGRIKQNKRLQLDDEQSAALSRRSWNVPARMTQRSAAAISIETLIGWLLKQKPCADRARRSGVRPVVNRHSS